MARRKQMPDVNEAAPTPTEEKAKKPRKPRTASPFKFVARVTDANGDPIKVNVEILTITRSDAVFGATLVENYERGGVVQGSFMPPKSDTTTNED